MSNVDDEIDRRHREAERLLASLREQHGSSFPDASPSECHWSFADGTATLFVNGVPYTASPCAA